jgi:serine/threonine protein kinase
MQNEIEIMKFIDHPNIVKVFAIAEDEKYIYIVMEMLRGGEVSPASNLNQSIIVVRPNL